MQKRNNALNDAMKQLRQSYEQEGSLVEGKKKDDSYLETDMKKRRENNEKAIEDMKKTKGYSDMVKSARKAMGVHSRPHELYQQIDCLSQQQTTCLYHQTQSMIWSNNQ